MEYFGIYEQKRVIFRSIFPPKLAISAIFDTSRERSQIFFDSVKSVDITLKFIETCPKRQHYEFWVQKIRKYTINYQLSTPLE